MERDICKRRWRWWAGALALVLLCAGSSAWATNDNTVDNGNTLSVPPDITYDNEYIGYNDAGTLNQTASTNTVNEVLYLGYNSTGSGTYNLSGSGSLSAPIEYLGYSGTGTFTQTGGSNTITSASGLFLGFYSGSSGSYALSGSGSLSAQYEAIGWSGNGTFNQTGGSNTVVYFGLGGYSGSSGTYNLSGGGILSAYSEGIGANGSGTFNQSGGTNTVTNLVIPFVNPAIQSGSSGSYNLSGGSLNATAAGLAGIAITNGGSFSQTGGSLYAATFFQQGGTVTAASSLQNQGTFTYYSGTFDGRLLNYGTANLSAGGNSSFTAGNGIANYSNFTLPLGFNLVLNGQGLDNSGTLILAGGTLAGNGPLVNNASMLAFGTIGGSGGFTNNGSFLQSGDLALNNTGGNSNYGTINLAYNKQFTLGSGVSLSNMGTINLSNGSIGGSGWLYNNSSVNISGPGTIASNFSNSSLLSVPYGTTSITLPFVNTGLIQLGNSGALINGGAINNQGGIEGYGTVANNISNTGRIEAIGSTLNLTGQVTNNAGGVLTSTSGKVLVTQGLASNAGSISLSGGAFDNYNYPLTNSGQISGYGSWSTGGLSNQNTMNLTGGPATVNGPVTNQAEGQVNITANSTFFTGAVTNNGTVKNTSAIITWAGGFTNNGSYISDPGTQYFTDLVVSTTGYLVGGAGDKWSISGNFINNSTQNTSWVTRLSDLAFTTGASNQHQLYVTGADLGPSGFNNNFAWGTLDLTGQDLTLLDGNNTPGGAFYVGQILGLTFSGNTLTDITGNGLLNIYYDPTLNPSLGGQTFTLNGGGELEAAVPLPASVWLFLSGLAGLGLLGRGRMAKKS